MPLPLSGFKIDSSLESSVSVLIFNIYANIVGRETLWKLLFRVLINSHDCRAVHFEKWKALKFLAILPLIRILSCTMAKCTVYTSDLYILCYFLDVLEPD